jgi:hypothetical protein
MLTIITPCYRQKNIAALYDSIQFDKITKWIIVYDTSNDRKYDKLYENHPKIIELECSGGISGNPQRNYALNIVEDGYVYFLDDDNIIHHNFWSIVDGLDGERFYTFDQLRKKNGEMIHGNNIAFEKIDTAMYIVHRKHIGTIRWRLDIYQADFYFIHDINVNNKGAHMYLNTIGCYYNYLL